MDRVLCVPVCTAAIMALGKSKLEKINENGKMFVIALNLVALPTDESKEH